MKTMGEVIKSLRLERHLSQDQFAKIFNVASSAVGMWENNRRVPNEETKEAIADYFNVDMNYLYGKTPIRNSYRYAMMYKDSGIEFFNIPLYPPICCGDGLFIEDEVIEYVPIPSKGLSPSQEYFCQIAKGDSMNGAGIEDGDLLVFEKTSDIHDGTIGCFCIDENEAVCKKYRHQRGIILLQSMNSKYDPIIVDALSTCFRCIGKLKKSVKEFNQ